MIVDARNDEMKQCITSYQKVYSRNHCHEMKAEKKRIFFVDKNGEYHFKKFFERNNR